ncbi:hypothetical protein GEMRC1_001800 [Eukaryota sp. GEM-RC1]
MSSPLSLCVYILISPLLSVLYVIILVPLFLIGLVLSPVLIGLPILMTAFLALRECCKFDLLICSKLMYGIPNFAFRPSVSADDDFLSHLKAFITNPKTYSALFWFLVVRPFASLTFAFTAFSTLSVVLSSMLAPVTYIINPEGDLCLTLLEQQYCLVTGESLIGSVFLAFFGFVFFHFL